MIDQIKNSTVSNTKNKVVVDDKSSPKVSVKSSTNVENNPSKEKTNIANVSKFISKDAVKKMASEPPVDKVSVSRIKNAIASNNYPIDMEKIADALMDAYKEMK